MSEIARIPDEQIRDLARALADELDRAFLEVEAEEKGASDFVYFIRAGGMVKIGRSRDPWKRMEALQTANAECLHLLGVVPNHESLAERALHQRFSHLRVRGEWFRLDDQLMAFIEDCETLRDRTRRMVLED